MTTNPVKFDRRLSDGVP